MDITYTMFNKYHSIHFKYLPDKMNTLKLNELIQGKYITRRQHPTLKDISILNYTNKTQFERKWDEITLRCRGLMMYKDTPISNPFPKFFNFNETEETKIENLPNEVPQIAEKMDGSLIIIQPYKDNILIATRGSFASEMALHAKDLVIDPQAFNPDYTYLFEIIYPENRIVVDYGSRNELVLIGVRHVATGKEDLDFRAEANRMGYSYPQQITSTIPNLIPMTMNLKGTESEGYVVKYSNGLRIKIKGEDYLRLHRVVTDCSDLRVLQAMKAGTLDDLLTNVPDEFHTQVQSSINEITGEKEIILRLASRLHIKVKDLSTRKEQAIALNEHGKWLAGLVYSMLDGRSQDVLDRMAYSLIDRKHVKW